jgi:hypothetical protein
MLLVRFTAGLTAYGTRLFDTSFALERGIVLFRIGASPVLASAMVFSRDRLPHWELMAGSIGILLLCNLFFLTRLGTWDYRLVALLGTIVDTVLLLVASNIAIRGSATIDVTSDLWLIYPLVIIGGAYRFRPTASVGFTLLLSVWYGAHILTLFPSESRTYDEFPVRISFFVLMGILATVMNAGLRRRNR